MIFIVIILVAIVAAGLGAVAGVTLDRATRPVLPTAPATLSGPQKMICPYDGLELTGDQELDLAVHLQCINMSRFSLQMEAEKRAQELFDQKVLALPPPPKWDVHVNVRSGRTLLEYRYRWEISRDGQLMDSGSAAYATRAYRIAERKMIELQRRDS